MNGVGAKKFGMSLKARQTELFWQDIPDFAGISLSGPLNRLNAILSLLQPLDHYRTISAMGSAIGRPYLALSRIHAQAGALNRLVLNRLGVSTAR